MPASTLKNKIFTTTFSIAMTLGFSSIISYKILHDIMPETRKIQKKHSNEKIEGLVKLVQTPKEAFRSIDKQITLQDDEILFNSDRWLSLSESYSTKAGDCEDGAIAFCALLSDNPEYETKLAWLKKDDKKRSHIIAIYKEGGKYGYASFNNRILKYKFSIFSDNIFDSLNRLRKSMGPHFRFNYLNDAKYDSIEELMETSFRYYTHYGFLEFHELRLKFGRDLKKSPETIDWIGIK